MPGISALERAGHSMLEDESLGSMVAAAFLATGGINADSAAEAWAGDRFVLLAQEGRFAYAWALACRDMADAADLQRMMKTVGPAHLRARGVTVRSAQEGRYLLITGNLLASLHETVLRELRRGSSR
jgi:hypothetical protein